MLIGIDPLIHAELIYALMLMGHGDELVICDINHPAQTIAKQTTFGKLIDVSGCGIPRARCVPVNSSKPGLAPAATGTRQAGW